MIALTANAIFDEAWLLCFDEFHVTDIADDDPGRLFSCRLTSALSWWRHPTSRLRISTRAA